LRRVRGIVQKTHSPQLPSSGGHDGRQKGLLMDGESIGSTVPLIGGRVLRRKKQRTLAPKIN
jgi:hypothetical protein